MIHGNIDGYEDGMLLEISPTDPLVPNSGLGEGDFFFRVRALSGVPARLLIAKAFKVLMILNLGPE